MTTETRERLEYLRGELRAEQISYGELAELQDLARFIDPGDVELLEAAGVPEFEEEYDGTSYFWAYAYRYPMRDVPPHVRRRIHSLMLRRGLDPEGESDAHKQAIRDGLWARDRARLTRCYGDVRWAWWA